MSKRKVGATLLSLVMCTMIVSCGASGEEGATVPESDADDSSIGGASPSQSTSAATPLNVQFEGEISDLIEVTERVRGLQFLEQPKVLLLEPEPFLQRLEEIAEEEYADVEAFDALCTLLGLLEPEDSLEDYYKSLITQSVSAYYDSDTREVVVPIDETGFDMAERSSLVHELVHALTDQHFNFGATYDSLDEEYKYDQLFALQALVEGDAVESEKVYFISELTPDEQSDITGYFEPADSNPEQSLPFFLEESLSFPYAYGGYFVKSLLDENALTFEDDKISVGKGFFEAVNAAYSNLPVSTEQIYQPEKYPDELPVDIEHPIPEVSGYELDHASTWGALWFSLMFDQVFESGKTGTRGRRPTQAGIERPAVEGWGADVYSHWFDGADTAFALSYRGDEASDASELFEAFREYVSTAMNVGEPSAAGKSVTWRGEDFAWLSISGDMLRFIAASDPEVGDFLVSNYDDF